MGIPCWKAVLSVGNVYFSSRLFDPHGVCWSQCFKSRAKTKQIPCSLGVILHMFDFPWSCIGRTLGYLFRKSWLHWKQWCPDACSFHKVARWIKWGHGKVGFLRGVKCLSWTPITVVSFSGYNLGFSKALKNLFHPLLLYYYLNC